MEAFAGEYQGTDVTIHSFNMIIAYICVAAMIQPSYMGQQQARVALLRLPIWSRGVVFVAFTSANKRHTSSCEFHQKVTTRVASVRPGAVHGWRDAVRNRLISKSY